MPLALAGSAFTNATMQQHRPRRRIVRDTFETLGRDIRYSAHLLGKSPSFTFTAVLTLAVAIGANAVVFSAINGFILRPLGLPHEETLYHVERTIDGDASESYPNYVDIRDRTRAFEGLAAENYTPAWLDTGDRPVTASVFEVSGNYFDVLGIQPFAGRFFHAADEHGPNSAPFLVLSYNYWYNHFRGDTGVFGRQLRINGHPFTVVGVAPRGFHGTVAIMSPDFYLPIVHHQQVDGGRLDVRGIRWLTMFGHLKPGVTPAQATADLNVIAASLRSAYPQDDEKIAFALTRTQLSGDSIDAPVHAFLLGLMALAALILLAACANLGSLFAARASDRSREIAVRRALGASGQRIVVQLFTEAVLIAIAGGALGLWGGSLLLEWLSTWRPFPLVAITLPIAPDGRVYAAALMLSVASAFLFALIPAVQVLRIDPHDLIKSGTRTTGERRLGLREVLVAVQIAICAVLVTSSLVAVRGLVRSLHADIGFEARHALLVETDLGVAGYDSARIAPMQARMVAEVRRIPGVASVALVATNPPLHLGWSNLDLFADDATDRRPSTRAADAVRYQVSPDYFRTAGTALLVGRDFTAHDDAAAPRVAIVNEVGARKLFGSSATAIGRFFRLKDGTRVQVVGVAQDGKYTANLAEPPTTAVFFPILQSPAAHSWLVVRSPVPPEPLASAVRAAIRGLDPALPPYIVTWEHDMDSALFTPRVAAVSLGILGAMGAIVAITGIFGMAAYSLTNRLKDLGIRMALGAQRRDVLQAVLSRSLRLLAWGSGAGLVLGVLAGRVLGYIVYEATPRDPLVLTGVVVAMASVGLLATWIPARRALSLDPLALLREE